MNELLDASNGLGAASSGARTPQDGGINKAFAHYAGKRGTHET